MIEYEDIDIGVREVVRYLNEEMGIKTIFSCSGHAGKDEFKGHVGIHFSHDNLMLVNDIYNKMLERLETFVIDKIFKERIINLLITYQVWTNVEDEEIIFLKIDFRHAFNNIGYDTSTYQRDIEAKETFQKDVIDKTWNDVLDILKDLNTSREESVPDTLEDLIEIITSTIPKPDPDKLLAEGEEVLGKISSLEEENPETVDELRTFNNKVGDFFNNIGYLSNYLPEKSQINEETIGYIPDLIKEELSNCRKKTNEIINKIKKDTEKENDK